MENSKKAANRFPAYLVGAGLVALVLCILGAIVTTGSRPPADPTPSVADWDWLGLEVSTLSRTESETLGLPASSRGVIVDGVSANKGAAQAGLQLDDVIVQINERKIESSAEFWSTMNATAPGSRISFSVLRGKEVLELALVYKTNQPFALA